MTDERKLENTVEHRVLAEIKQPTESGAPSGDALGGDVRLPAIYPGALRREVTKPQLSSPAELRRRSWICVGIFCAGAVVQLLEYIAR